MRRTDSVKNSAYPIFLDIHRILLDTTTGNMTGQSARVTSIMRRRKSTSHCRMQRT